MAEEKNFEERIKAYLKLNGCWYVKFFANRNTRSGVPDILACCGGTFVGIEVKAPHGRPTDLQLYNCRKIWDAGGIAVVAWPRDFEALKELMTFLAAGGGRGDVSHLIFEGYYLHPMSV